VSTELLPQTNAAENRLLFCRDEEMNHVLKTIFLSPLLITQGLYVRRVTPRMPEPSGERSGIFGSGPAIKLLILGDSAAAGVGVATQRQALSGQLVLALGTYFQISWKLMAQTGLRAKDVLVRLTAVPAETFDVVVTSIGVNDVTYKTKPRKWIDHQSQIVKLLRTKFHARHIILSSLPPMHLFSALPQPLRWYLGTEAGRLNALLKQLAAGCPECEFVAIDFPLDKSYLAADGFHPGEPAYAFWSRHVAEVIRRRLSETTRLLADYY